MTSHDLFTDTLLPDEAASRIAAMTIRGAAKIGRTAALALGRLAKDAPEASLRRDLAAAGKQLVAARPTAVSLRNAVNLTLDGLPEKDTKGLRNGVLARAGRYVAESEAATARIAARVAATLPDKAVILTHCHSSLAVAAIAAVHKAHPGVRVFADETRPWWQGHLTSKQLAESGVDVTLVVDSAAHSIMESEHVTHVVVGADTVTADGALYNKVGTRAVALGAKSLNIPFLVCAETHKFSPYSLDGELPAVEERDTAEVLASPAPGVKIRNPVFDRTPPDLVTRYMTEAGPLAPADVRGYILDRFGTREGWL